MAHNLLQIGVIVYMCAMALAPLALLVLDIWAAYEKPRWQKCAEEMPEEDASVLFSDGKTVYKGCWTTWDGGCSDFSYETFAGWVEDGSGQGYDFWRDTLCLKRRNYGIY